MDQFITQKKLQEQLGISRSTLHRYKTKFGFPFIKLAGKTFYNIDEIAIFLKEFQSHYKSSYNENK